jgi:methyl-accepting chemotaxis protein
MKISYKILLGFGAVVVLTLGMGWYGLAKLEEVQDVTSRIVERDFSHVQLLHKIALLEKDLRVLRERVLQEYLLGRIGLAHEDPAALEGQWRRSLEQVQGLLAELESVSAEYKRSAASAQRGAQWGRIEQAARESQKALKDLAEAVEVQFGLLNRGDLNQMIARRGEVARLRRAFEEKTESGVVLVREALEIAQAEATAYEEDARSSVLVVLLAVLVLGSGAGLAIQRSISRPLGAFMQFVEKVGQGDLSQEAAAGQGDELGRLGQSLNQMVSGLREVAGQTRGATENLTAASAEILASTQQQAASTAEQATAVQQTTATMQQIAQTGAQVSERARQVAAAAEATSAASQSGLQAVQSTSRAMEAIREQVETTAGNIVALSEKTQAIGEITATVTDVAEQSNLLALNAAIEAAAAGEQGRSFSVVAAEMKNLADQAREATVQVRSILGEIQKGINTSVMLTEEAVKRVEAGKQQVGVADATIRQMADSIQESVQAFQQITAAANQQQIGFDQVAQALQNIRQASEQNAAGTRQLEKAAADLNALGQQLRKAVERYRT